MMAEPANSGSTPPNHKADAIDSLVSGPLPAAASKLADCSRRIPSCKDFHFYNNFDDFKSPVKDIRQRSESLLRSFAASGGLWGNKKPPQLPEDIDDACEWLANLNDELVERLSISMDEFKALREKEEGDVVRQCGAMETDGFQLVNGKKKKGSTQLVEQDGSVRGSTSSTAVNVASKDKKTTALRSKVPFHIPTIPRPQDEHSILVNNNNQPFDHVWLEKSEDGSRYIHPLEKLSLHDFIDRSISETDPVKPPSLESTPFKLVEGVNDLKELAAKLRNVSEFAVDLEHNQYRSFQGLTCLMQISTRTEDFVVDTLKLRIHIGPYLREVFKDPLKRKIMHGADRDIIWLQRDFGIYVCNLFDTGQASRVLQLERNSLEYLLHFFCEVNANKEYQNADWRLRPLPVEMIKYSREDTHYLLYVYDLMRRMLLSASSDENDLLTEVYRRSAEVCMQLYEKELLTENSYLHIYGLTEAGFNSQQLAVVSGLCMWRDSIARVEDESTGYILPNKALLEIARQMPLAAGKLKRLVKSKHPYVERYLSSVLSTIKNAIENSAAFESIAEQLKKGRFEMLQSQNRKPDQNSEPLTAGHVQMNFMTSQPVGNSDNLGITLGEPTSTFAVIAESTKPVELKEIKVPVCTRAEQENNTRNVSLSEAGRSSDNSNTYGGVDKLHLNTESGDNLESREGRCHTQQGRDFASVQILKKPTGAFGALFGKPSSQRKVTPYKGVNSNQEDNVNKVEQIKSSVALPFVYFSGENKPDSDKATVNASNTLVEIPEERPTPTAESEEIIMLEKEDRETQSQSDSAGEDDDKDIQPESKYLDEQMSAALSATFGKNFQPIRESSQQNTKPSKKPEINYQLKPFDYDAARKSMNFSLAKEENSRVEDDNEGSKDSRRKASRQAREEERPSDFQAPRRSQAFPPSGNRSMSYH